MSCLKILDEDLCIIVHYKNIPWQVVRDVCKRSPTQVYYQEFYPEGTKTLMSTGELIRHFVDPNETAIYRMKGEGDYGKTQG